MNRVFLRLEGLTVLIVSICLYKTNDLNWLLFFVLLLAPDFSMIGYVMNKKFGALLYNLIHSYIFSLPFVLLGIFMREDIVLSIGLIWTAHIGMDRGLGYGLKYETGFKDTHLNQV